MPPAVTALPLDFGPYRLLRRLGAGGMGEVYEARQGGADGKPVAVKLLLPQLAHKPRLVNSFIDEASIGAKLFHPNIVQIFDFGEIAGHYFLAMELVDGWDLSRLVELGRRFGRRLPLPAAAFVVREVALALHYLHRHELAIVHRDVSPHNIFITRAGKPLLADFGVAKADERLSTTAEGELKGKLSYMAPEQVQGLEVSPRTDVYAAALVLHRLVTGRSYYQGDTPAEILAAIAGARYRSIIDAVPGAAAFDGILERALHPDAAQRTRDAALLASQLDRLLAADPFGERELAGLAQQLEAAEMRRLGHDGRAEAEIVTVMAEGTAPAAADGTLRLETGDLELGISHELTSPATVPTDLERAVDRAETELELASLERTQTRGSGGSAGVHDLETVALQRVPADGAPAVTSSVQLEQVTVPRARRRRTGRRWAPRLVVGGVILLVVSIAALIGLRGGAELPEPLDETPLTIGSSAGDAPRRARARARARVQGAAPSMARAPAPGPAPGKQPSSPRKRAAHRGRSNGVVRRAAARPAPATPARARPGRGERLRRRDAGRLKAALARARAAGLWPEDAAPLRRLVVDCTRAIDGGEAADAALARLERFVERFEVDRSFIQRKMRRLEQAIERASPAEARRLQAGSRVVLRLVVRDQLVQASKRISALLSATR